MKRLTTFTLAFLVAACGGATAPTAGPTTPAGASSPGANASAASADSLALLGSAAAYGAMPNATLSDVSDVPSGYTGTSIQASVVDLPAGTAAQGERPVTLDLSGYPDTAMVKVWFKESTLTNFHTLHVVFRSATGFAAFGFQPQQAGTWHEVAIAKGSPSSINGIDWAAIIGISVRAEAAAAGPYTGQLLFSDLRLTR
jgi:hypothetical protein